MRACYISKSIVSYNYLVSLKVVNAILTAPRIIGERANLRYTIRGVPILDLRYMYSCRASEAGESLSGVNIGIRRYIILDQG